MCRARQDGARELEGLGGHHLLLRTVQRHPFSELYRQPGLLHLEPRVCRLLRRQLLLWPGRRSTPGLGLPWPAQPGRCAGQPHREGPGLCRECHIHRGVGWRPHNLPPGGPRCFEATAGQERERPGRRGLVFGRADVGSTERQPHGVQLRVRASPPHPFRSVGLCPS